MDFSHYSDAPVDLAIDLVNSSDEPGGALSDLAHLNDFLDSYENLWDGVARPPAARDLPGVRRLRDTLRDVISSPDDTTASARLNEILTEHGAEPRVSIHSGVPHLHFEPVGSRMLDWLGAVTAMGLASVIVDHGVERFGVCSARDCEDVFIDTSRNRSRKNCSSTCSTREAVAAYRKRKSG
jgi:predicted RNA-binding Zn ribbon-like protein